MTVIYKQFVKLRTELLTNINVSIVTLLPLLLHCALCIHLIYYTPTNALFYCNSLKSLQ